RAATDAAIVATPLVVGAVGGLQTANAVRTWYRTLDRPAWNPPDRVFGPVWTALYATMGVSCRLVVRSPTTRERRALALALFATQLALNFGWSWIFFVRHALGPAVLEILALWVAIALTIAAFARVRGSAGALLLPYLAWVTFASVLTVSIWRRNA
ncbi:MAG TPA: TspO/MBR family protein, partial [Candidatus Limnocylindrales bacterium]